MIALMHVSPYVSRGVPGSQTEPFNSLLDLWVAGEQQRRAAVKEEPSILILSASCHRRRVSSVSPRARWIQAMNVGGT